MYSNFVSSKLAIFVSLTLSKSQLAPIVPDCWHPGAAGKVTQDLEIMT